MCTLTWLVDAQGHTLCFNRDERRSRRPALGPLVESVAGVRFIAPRDGDFGGTWIATNELGLSLTLLNLYEREPKSAPPGAISRGLLVRDLAGATDLATWERRLASATLARYQPFLLAAFAGGDVPRLARWSGTDLTLETLDLDRRPLVSSGYDVDGATRRRSETFARHAPADGAWTGDRLRRFHASHEPERGPYSPCMHREDAATVSFTTVAVDARRVRLAYAPGPPCETPLGDPIELPRRSPPGDGPAPRA